VKKADLEAVILPDENGDASAATEDRVVRKKFVLPESFLNKLRNSGIVDEIVERATAKFTAKQMKQGDGKKNVRRIVGIPKLEDANLAGTKDGHLCTLILTEV
jgi:DNA topoisomerase-2